MGRTNPTFRDTLSQFEQRWQPYRRALRDEEQAAFDRLFERARAFADASGIQNPAHPQDAILLSMVLSIAIEQRTLEERLTALEASAE